MIYDDLFHSKNGQRENPEIVRAVGERLRELPPGTWQYRSPEPDPPPRIRTVPGTPGHGRRTPRPRRPGQGGRRLSATPPFEGCAKFCLPFPPTLPASLFRFCARSSSISCISFPSRIFCLNVFSRCWLNSINASLSSSSDSNSVNRTGISSSFLLF